jgi:hypothetical protein
MRKMQVQPHRRLFSLINFFSSLGMTHGIRRWKHTALAVVGLLLTFEGRAQTIAAALDQAWSRHPQAVTFVARAAEVTARADLAASFTPTAPSISLSNVSDRLNADAGKDAWELEVAVPLWLPGLRAARVLESANALNDVRARQVALRQQIAGELREVLIRTKRPA